MYCRILTYLKGAQPQENVQNESVHEISNNVVCAASKVSKGAKIRNRYNQVPHLTQYTNGKVTNSQLDTTNESQEVSLRSAHAYAQCDQSLCYSFEYSMNVKLLTEHHLKFLSLIGGVRGSSESTFVNMSHCRQSHSAVQI